VDCGRPGVPWETIAGEYAGGRRKDAADSACRASCHGLLDGPLPNEPYLSCGPQHSGWLNDIKHGRNLAQENGMSFDQYEDIVGLPESAEIEKRFNRL
jgi:hypothetical protein